MMAVIILLPARIFYKKQQSQTESDESLNEELLPLLCTRADQWPPHSQS